MDLAIPLHSNEFSK